jgi:hypothetical protein
MNCLSEVSASEVPRESVEVATLSVQRGGTGATDVETASLAPAMSEHSSSEFELPVDPLADAETVILGKLWIRDDLLILNNNAKDEADCCTQTVSRSHSMMPLRQITGVHVRYRRQVPVLVGWLVFALMGASCILWAGSQGEGRHDAVDSYLFAFIFVVLCVVGYCFSSAKTKMTLTIESAYKRMEIAIVREDFVREDFVSDLKVGCVDDVEEDDEGPDNDFRTCQAYKAAMTVDKARRDLLEIDAIQSVAAPRGGGP